MKMLLITLSLIGIVTLIMLTIMFIFYTFLRNSKYENETYEVVYITDEQLEQLLKDEKMLELVINNKKTMIKVYE